MNLEVLSAPITILLKVLYFNLGLGNVTLWYQYFDVHYNNPNKLWIYFWKIKYSIIAFLNGPILVLAC